MLLNEAVAKMQNAVTESMKRLEGNGFVMSVETDYMGRNFASVEDASKAKCVTVSLVVGAKDGDKGEEYCMSLGAMIQKGGVNEEQLDKDIESYGKRVDEALDTLAYYENKDEGLAFLTEKATKEYEELMKKIDEEQRKNRKIAMISNIVFAVGIAILFILAIFK